MDLIPRSSLKELLPQLPYVLSPHAAKHTDEPASEGAGAAGHSHGAGGGHGDADDVDAADSHGASRGGEPATAPGATPNAATAAGHGGVELRFEPGQVFAPKATQPEPGGRTALPPTSRLYPPMNYGDQGINTSEAEHGLTLTDSLLNARGVQWAATYHEQSQSYEIRGSEGSVSFQRYQTPDGELRFLITGTEGTSPIPSMDPGRLVTIEQIRAAAGGSERPVPHEATSYPDVFRRVSQLFDDANAPDIIFSSTPGGAYSAGMHGSAEVVQSRAPLIVAGPGVARGATTDALAATEDIAPTIAEYLGVEKVEGIGPAGTKREQYLKWQDGDSLAPALRQADAGTRTHGSADQAMLFIIDGASHAVLEEELAKGNLPNIEKLTRRGTTFENGSIAQYPSMTWANHNTLNTGASPGHHGILNNHWVDRSTGEEHHLDAGYKKMRENGTLLNDDVETIYEAVDRTFGDDTVTMAANQPPGARGADINTAENKGLGKLARHPLSMMKNLIEGVGITDLHQGWSDRHYLKKSTMDNIAASSAATAVKHGETPKFTTVELLAADEAGHHYGPESKQAREALQEADRNIGRVLRELEAKGELDETLVMVTADHGMGTQAPEEGGGWNAEIKASGVEAWQQSRFVYINSMNVQAQLQPPSGDGESPAALQVRVTNDDVDARGVQPPLDGATLRVVDARGQQLALGTTDAAGAAQLRLPATLPPGARLIVEREGFTTEEHPLQAS